MARGKAHEDATKATVFAAMLAGASISEVCREHGIPETTVKRWRRELRENAGVVGEKRKDLSEMVLGLVEDTITTLRAQAVVLQDPEWLRQQSASDVGILIGIQHDKLARLLSAFKPVQEPEAGEVRD